MVVEAWAPIGQGKELDDAGDPGVAGNPECTVAVHACGGPCRRRRGLPQDDARRGGWDENLEIVDFELGADDLAAISALDRGEADHAGQHPNTMDWLG